MKNENHIESTKITRRKFIKTSIALSAASAVMFSLPGLGRSKPAFSNIQGFIDPYGVAVGQNGHIYVTDAGGYCFKIFDANGNLIKKVGTPGSDNGQFNYPQGIDVDSETGEIYVVDSNNGRLSIFDAEGGFKRSYGTVGGYPGAFYTPKGISVRDKIYACNTRNHGLAVFEKAKFKLIGHFGDLGDDPENLARGSQDYHFRIVTDVAVSENGNMYIVDSKHGQVKVLSPDGGFLFKFSDNGSGAGQLNFPEGIAIDSRQNIYVCDTINGRIQRFSPDGELLGIWNEGVKKPVSICIDSNSKIYVTDSELKTVHIFTWEY